MGPLTRWTFKSDFKKMNLIKIKKENEEDTTRKKNTSRGTEVGML